MHTPRKWRFGDALAVTRSMSEKGAHISTSAAASAADYDRSTSYWRAAGGDAARNLSAMHHDDLNRSVSVLSQIASTAASAIAAIESEVSVLDGK